MPVSLDAPTAQRFLHGNPVTLSETKLRSALRGNDHYEKCRVYRDTELLGIGALDFNGQLKPVRLLAAEQKFS